MARPDSTDLAAGESAKPRSVLRFALAAPALLAGLALLPRIHQHPRLLAAVLGAALALVLLLVALRRVLVREGRQPLFSFQPRPVHYVQGLMQLSIYLYWARYWPEVYAHAPLILAQIFFVSSLSMIIGCWRRNEWELGFGALPICLSVNLFLWFRDDWFFLQFLMLAGGVLAKEFITWRRDGRITHVFNPSAVALFVVSLILLATHATAQTTWATQIADTVDRPPQIFLVIFLASLVVQALFSVTLVTLAAVSAVCLANLVFFRLTGVYGFVDTNFPAAVFIGTILLVTDPATSPKRGLGKAMFGVLYGAGVFALYPLLVSVGAPPLYDKLLIVPALNLSVRALDRLSLAITGRWPSAPALSPRAANFAFMAIWAILFGGLSATGYLLDGPRHPGGDIALWRKACAEDRFTACTEFVGTVLSNQCLKNRPRECVELGEFVQEGRKLARDPLLAAESYDRACELGFEEGCAHLAALLRADGFAALSNSCDSGRATSCFILGSVMLRGVGMPANAGRAVALFERACDGGDAPACGRLGGCYFRGLGAPRDRERALKSFERACLADDVSGCEGSAAIFADQAGSHFDAKLGADRLARACDLGDARVCSRDGVPHAQLEAR